MGATASNQRFGDKKSTAKKAERFNNAKFISCELSSEDKKRCKDWDYSAEDAFTDLDAISEEYRISFKYDSYGRCSGCWIQPIDPSHEDAGYVLAGRGSSCLKAFKQAIFVWRVLGRGESWKQFDRERPYDLDD